MQTQRNGARAVEERLLRVNAQRVPRPFFALGKRSGWGWVFLDDLRSISRSSALVFAGVGFRGLTSNAA